MPSSSGVSGSERSSTTITNAATSRAADARDMPSTSTGSLEPIRTPAVSTNVTGTPHMSTVSVSKIAGRPWDIRHDRPPRARERVEEARFPGVRPAGDDDLRAFANEPATAGRFQQRIELLDEAAIARAAPSCSTK